MTSPLLLSKPKGLTPLQAITHLKKIRPELKDKTLSYAGRLDPMAEGLLLVLVAEQNKTRTIYEYMDKTYEFTLLCGVNTDTYDPLGLTLQSSRTLPKQTALAQALDAFTTSLPSSLTLPYPPYSSKPVSGKPLFWWARQHRLDEISIPTRRVSITSLSPLSSKLISATKLKNEILHDISLVQGDFRQEEIRKSWEDFFTQTPLPSFPLFQFQISCSSGTYIRSLCQYIGEQIGVPCLAYSIKRTSIGPYTLEESISLV